MGKKLIEKLVIKILPEKVQKIIISNNKKPHDKYSRLSYAQEGEDLLLERIFGTKKNGFYVDVGAHHPFRFSNTYLFYKKGWNGINLDAMPGSMDLFKIYRGRDINLEVAVSDVNEKLKYYMFNESALNTFSESEAKKKDGIQDFKITNTNEIATRRLDEILEIHLPENQTIDFMTIDVEGFDMKVINSNNWNKFRPKILLIEDLVKDSSDAVFIRNELQDTLKAIGYNLIFRTFNTYFFQDSY